ncbi:retinol dehydrogenase 14-like [Panonychus citri]|uniref:retinol dehydrogenase 14-like n=1 Tax=Panonychus citri TaxID=50023 RepID=UPI002307A56A|nr:retinol dehydrogenase 14-like [Panonychus citri]
MEPRQRKGCFWSLLVNFWDMLGYGFYFIYPFKKIKCPTDDKVEGKTVLITGATQGIGKSTAIELAKRGAKLILACRNLDQANQLAREIESFTSNKVLTVHLDLTSLQSVRQCASTILSSVDRLDILINNAGMAGNPKRKVTIDGFEQVMQVNHFGPWLFTRLLLPLVKSSSPGRIIFTASSAHRFIYSLNLDNLNSEKNYSFRTVYAKSKLANILTTNYLSSMLKDFGITVNSFCPGPVNTHLAGDLTGPTLSFLMKPFQSIISRTPDQGAQTLIYLATDKSLDSVTGKHFMDCKPMNTSRLASDFDLAVKTWEVTEKILENHFN